MKTRLIGVASVVAVSSLRTVHGAQSVCTLCDEEHIDPLTPVHIPGYDFVDNCKTLADTLPLLFNDDQEECHLIRQIGTRCGCPKRNDACELCQDGADPENPFEELPFLAGSFLGMTPNCQIVQSYLHSYGKEETTCGLSQRLLADFCGCPEANEVQKKTEPKCTLCGSTVRASDNVFEFTKGWLNTHANRTIDVTNFPFRTCLELSEGVESLLIDGSDDCSAIQDGFGAYCGCPQQQEAKQEPQCTLCKDGTEAPLQTAELAFLNDQFLGLTPTCELIESSILRFDMDSPDCQEAQMIGSHCGCNPIENACIFCQVGEITNPDKLLPQVEHIVGFVPTCAQFETLLLQLPSSDINCVPSQELDFLCGCRDGLHGYHGTESVRDQRILHYLPKVTGALSVLGALLIIFDVYGRNKQGRIYNKIMSLMAMFDLITGIVWVVGSSLAVPEFDEYGDPTGVLGAEGSTLGCKAQAFFVQLGFGSIFYNISLNAYFLLVVVHNWSESRLQRVKPYLFIVPALMATVLALCGIPFYQYLPWGCWIRMPPYSDSYFAGGFFGILWIVLATSLSTIAVCTVFVKFFLQMKASKKWQFTRNKKGGVAREAFHQGLFYLINLYISWPIIVIAIVYVDSQSFIFWCVVFFVAPIQGFTNFLTYMRPRFVKWVQTFGGHSSSSANASRTRGRRNFSISIGHYNSSNFIDNENKSSNDNLGGGRIQPC